MCNRLIAVCLLSILSLSPLLAATKPEDEVQQRENGFAAAFAARDQKQFASFIAPDATFIVNGQAASGREAIVKAWEGFLSTPQPPFSWKSEHVYVDASGAVAMSLGGVFDPQGTRIANFTSFWRKQNGQWHVVFDGPGSPARPKQ